MYSNRYMSTINVIDIKVSKLSGECLVDGFVFTYLSLFSVVYVFFCFILPKNHYQN